MRPLAFLLCLAAAALAPASEPDLSTVDGGHEAILRAARAIRAPRPSVQPRWDESSIREVIRRKMGEAGIELNWDGRKDRMAGIATYKVSLGGNATFGDYMGNRQLAAMGALLKAQVALSRWKGTQAEMSVAINDPGNPFAMEASTSGGKADIERKLTALRSDLKELGLQLSEAEESAVSGVTTVDRLRITADAIVRRLDSKYEPENVAGAKRAKVQELKSRLSEVQGQVARLETNYTQYRKAYSRSLEAGITLKYDQVIFGLSAVAWAENLRPDGELTVGLGWVWSPRLAAAVHGALIGDPSHATEAARGDLSVGDWVASQDPSTIGAFRYYVDHRGDRWFLGTAAVPSSVDDADQIAQLNSMIALFMPLNARLVGRQETRETQRSGEVPAEFVRSFMQDLRASASHNTQGVDETTYDVQWPTRSPDGGERMESVSVSVSSLNARSAAAALKAGVQMALSAAAVERENNRRILEQAQLLGLVEDAKQQANPSRVPSLKPGGKPRSGDNAGQEADGGRTSKATTRPVPGTRTSEGKTKDDF